MTSKAAHDLLRRAGQAGKAGLTPGRATRRQEYSASTKRALVDVARELFATQGYTGTSLDEIVAGARVTKGALYHHFTGKQQLFEAAFVAVEDAASTRIREVIAASEDPWERAITGLREFLAVTRTEEYRRIVIQEGPAVLGHERFREQEERSTFGLVQDIVASLLEPYGLPEGTIAVFTRLFFGAMSATGSAVSLADDPQQAADDAEGAIVLVLAGIRSLVQSDADLPTAEQLAPGLARQDGAGPRGS
jgi:AcrR family transcriptional regulator